ncbi:Heat shock factor protein [Elsinoe australis]|uniref:Heat shock factor protein n=1 Tax=Elsinoe australis TaxID=40998 RepID=A0A2P8A847_9PEZI|nr:Heat shock factor protein [Elsinoe australis]
MLSPADALKRSPGTNSPLVGQIPLAPAGVQYAQPAGNMNNQFGSFDPNALDSTGFDPALFPPNFQTVQPQAFPDINQIAPSPSNQLVRRPTNQQLQTRSPMLPQQQWLSPTQPNGRAWEELGGEEDELNQKAAIAKREAQAKRKQIPPFVLKLWSFLNEDKNTDLIRWTDGGTAFTVLDEDEFARTLIPELFKHNNYASFVRQLNMYGFHKKVGLNANSMKAAEKKTKDPNVYWHEYFRQGREDLLWLIQKPQSKSTSNKRKRGQDSKEGDSDEDKRTSPDMDNATLTQLRNGDSDMVVMPKTEVAALRSEVQRLQRQQNVISKMISHLKDQNEQFYRQASEFQSLHDRHENSINAILTFLATFYNRSLEAGVDLSNMFGNAGTPQQHGTVVDMGDNDYQDANTNANTNQQLQRFRKPQLLLQGSPVGRSSSQQPRQVSTQPNSNRNSASPPQTNPKNLRPSTNSATSSRQPTASPHIKDADSDSPSALFNSQPSDNADMMSLINAANASTPQNTSSPAFDFSTALNHAQSANGSNPLTPQQRNNMLNLIANQQPSTSSQSGANNALVTPTPPPMPDLDQYAKHQEQLEMLARLQKEQDSKVQDLAGRIQPLSPNGSIPGLPAEGLGNEPDFDFDAFLQSPYDGGVGGQGTTGAGPAQGEDPNGLGFDFGVGVDDGVGDDLFGDVQGSNGEESEGPRVESLGSESDGLGTGGVS